MKVKILLGALVSVLAISANAATVKLDPASSSLAWTGKKVTGQHHGSIHLKSGEVTIDHGVVKGGNFVIDMDTIVDHDLTDATYNKKLIGHLKSEDFFDVKKHPTARFVITKVTPIAGAAEGKPNYNVTGDLTIKGETHPVTFPALISLKNGKAQAKGLVTVDRTKYNIRYGSGKFFQGLGDKVINDNFLIDLDLTGSM